MSTPHDIDCERVRKQAYRYRRDELLGVEVASIDEHLQGCAACRDYYERLGILLNAASAWNPRDDATDADDLFAGIAGRIEADSVDDEASQDAPDEPVVADDLARELRPRRWIFAVAGLAAGVLLTLAGVYAFQHVGKPTGAATTVAEDSPAPPADREDDAPAASHPPFAKLAREHSGTKQVKVFASNGAHWSLHGNHDLTLDVDKGTLLVEFVPEGGRTLHVHAPDFSIKVVGTIFYVSADKRGPRAGVLAGKVEVERPHGNEPPTPLVAGREVDADFQPADMPAARTKTLASYVDVQAHLKKLAAIHREARVKKAHHGHAHPDNGVSTAVKSPTSTAAEHHLPPDLERLRSRAEQATRRGEYQEAVRCYRRLLERLPPMHPIAASVHLDLAQIYLHRLNSPGRAAPHLRIFVERWPTDVAAPSARRELCKIAEETGKPEVDCERDP